MSLARLPRRVARRAVYGHDGFGPVARLTSRIRQWWVVFVHPHGTVVFEGPAYLGPGFRLRMPGPGTFRVGPGVEFRRDFRAEISGDGSISIGGGSVFTYGVVMQCSTTIDLGDRVIFGQASLVVDGNHSFRDLDRSVGEQGYDYRPIRIGDDVLVTAKCTILADLGERCVVGANTAVTKPARAFSVVAGNPAREVSYFGPPDEDG